MSDVSTAPTGSAPKKESRFKDIMRNILRVVIPLGVSGGMLLWLFNKVDFHEVEKVIKEGCNYWWLILMMVITTLSHVIRGLRWGLQLRAAGVKRIPNMAYCVSIFGAYALNLILQSLGEVWRCVYMARRGHTKLSTVVGTDIGDRGSDAVMIILLFFFTLIVAKGPIVEFLNHYAIGKDIAHFTDNPWLWCVIITAVAAVWAVGHFFRKFKVVNEMDTNLTRVWNGFKVLFSIKGWGWYIVATVGIWTCYFFQTYVCFFAFPFTRTLVETPGTFHGMLPGLVAFVFGSFSMAVPSNGGLGPWNLAVMFALSLYGISDTDGAAFSLVVWSFQSVALIAAGIYSAIYIVAYRRRENDTTSIATGNTKSLNQSKNNSNAN